ncbi:MAG: DUF1587 domain-containing protein, partial [Verrucomicrobiota bacterium]
MACSRPYAFLPLLTLFFLLECGWSFDRKLQPFFEAHCLDCHDDLSQKGGLNLYELSTDLKEEATYAQWLRIYDRVALGEMPPPKKPRPTSSAKQDFAQALAPALTQAHDRHKGTVLRRLNRQEYENTLNDLFGTHLDLVSLLPEDGKSHGFDNVGESLGMSMVQLERYLDASRQVLDAAIAKTEAPLEPQRLTLSYLETAEGKKHVGKHWGQAPDGSVLFFRKQGYPTGMLRGSGAHNGPGLYRVRISGYAYQSEDPITFHLGGTSFLRGSDKPTFGYHTFQPGPLQTVETLVRFPERYMLSIAPEGLSDDHNFIRTNGTRNY